MTTRFMPGVVLQPAKRADLPTLARLIRRYFAFDQLHFDGHAIRSGLRQLLRNRSIGQAFLVLSNSRPAGYTILIDSFDLEFGGRVAFVTDLYLEPAYRRHGIGTAVMEKVEQFCRRRGVKTLELQAERRNRAALSFYLRLGFRRHNRVALSKRLERSSIAGV